MTIFTHDLLFRIVYGLGMFCGVALYWLVLLLAFGVIRLPRPSDESVPNLISAAVVIPLFFVMGYGGGRLTVLLVQRWARAMCPKCGAREVVVVFITFRSGRHRCRACGYAHLLRGEVPADATVASRGHEYELGPQGSARLPEERSLPCARCSRS